MAETPKPTEAATTAPSSETPKPEAKSDASPTQSLINEKSEEPKGAPEKYEDFKVPEGFVLDEDVAKEAGAAFKELDINQSGAQKLVDLFVKYTKEAHEAPFNAYREQRQKWREEINKNAEFGGSRLNATKASIAKVIDSFGKYAAGFKEAMDTTGAGDHPDVVGALYTVSKILTEGGAVRGNGPIELKDRGRTVADPNSGWGAPSAAQAMYPHLKSNQTG